LGGRHCGKISRLTVDPKRCSTARSCNLLLGDSIVQLTTLLVHHMAETIPLRSRLGIDRDYVVKTLRAAEVAIVNHTVL
jgi:hypothetical protein